MAGALGEEDSARKETTRQLVGVPGAHFRIRPRRSARLLLDRSPPCLREKGTGGQVRFLTVRGGGGERDAAERWGL